MLHLSNRNVGPPGSFRYHITSLADRAPTLSWVGPFHAFSDLMHEVEKRCRANSLPVPTEADVEDQMCQHLPPGHCRDASNHIVDGAGAMALSLRDVLEGTSILASWFRHGRRRVDRDEIVRRSYICNSCPWHVPLTGCQGCSGSALRALVNEIVASNPLPTDAMIAGCAVCKCSLPAKVRLHLSDILPHLPPDKQARLWEKCWIREGMAADDTATTL